VGTRVVPLFVLWQVVEGFGRLVEWVLHVVVHTLIDVRPCSPQSASACVVEAWGLLVGRLLSS
jgi:hypothetical protein